MLRALLDIDLLCKSGKKEVVTYRTADGWIIFINKTILNPTFVDPLSRPPEPDKITTQVRLFNHTRPYCS